MIDTSVIIEGSVLTVAGPLVADLADLDLARTERAIVEVGNNLEHFADLLCAQQFQVETLGNVGMSTIMDDCTLVAFAFPGTKLKNPPATAFTVVFSGCVVESVHDGHAPSVVETKVPGFEWFHVGIHGTIIQMIERGMFNIKRMDLGLVGWRDNHNPIHSVRGAVQCKRSYANVICVDQSAYESMARDHRVDVHIGDR